MLSYGVELADRSGGPLEMLKRLVLVGVGLASVIMILFPPFYVTHPNGVTYNLGYHYLLDPPIVGRSVKGSVNSLLLGVQILGLVVAGGSAYLLAALLRSTQREKGGDSVSSMPNAQVDKKGTDKTDIRPISRTAKLIYWIVLISVSALVSTYVASVRGEFSGDPISSVAFVLGGMVGLIAIPGFVAGVIKLGARLFKRRLSTQATYITIAFAWIVVAWANVNVANYESTILDTRGLTPYEPDAN